jgi:WhiB family redox-sensing transcriptional regulator
MARSPSWLWMGAVEPPVLNVLQPDWMVEADCQDLPLEMFFPQPGRIGAADAKKAIKVCKACPVRVECLAYAMTFPDRSLPGIWGGTTERERSRMHHVETPIRYRVGKPD